MNEAVASCRLDGETVPVWPVIRVVDVTASNMRKLGLTAADVRYVGRAGRFHKWLASRWGNPFRVGDRSPGNHRIAMDVEHVLQVFREYANEQPDEWWSELWEACDHGAKPLGCWCIDATHDDGQPVVCHAQVLAAELHKRFVEGNAS